MKMHVLMSDSLLGATLTKKVWMFFLVHLKNITNLIAYYWSQWAWSLNHQAPLFPINGWPCIKRTLLYQSGWNTSHCVPSPLFTSTVEVGSEGKNPLESPLSVWPVNPRFMSPVLTPPQKSVGINIHYHQNWVHEISDTWFWGKYEILQTKKALVMTDKRAPCIICCMRPEKARLDR